MSVSLMPQCNIGHVEISFLFKSRLISTDIMNIYYAVLNSTFTQNQCYVLVIGIHICTNAYFIPVKLPLISTEKSRETSAVFTSMADPDLQVRGGGHPDPEIRGSPGLQKNFFGPSNLILVEK